MKVSFIIPVYNVAKYLHQCVRSILEQNYVNIEVILVDDGSKDESPAICDSFTEYDKRVKCIHKVNGGASDARNVGLQAATGGYVVFVDGDDFWLSNDILSSLVAVAEQQPEADFIGYNCKYFYPDTNAYSPWVPYSDKLSMPVDKNTAIVELVKSGTFPMSPCLKLIKREFLIKNELYFVKGTVAEDIPWFIDMLDVCEKCSFVNKYVYAYRQNVAGSVTNSGGKRSFRCLLNIFETETDKVTSRSFDEGAKEALYSFLAYELCILLTYPNISGDTLKKLKSFRWLIDYDTNPKVKMVKRLTRLVGLPITIVMLKLYTNIIFRKS